MLNRTHFARGETQLLRRFWQSAGGFWRGPSAWKAWLLVIGLVANVLLALLTQYWLNFWNRDFFNAVGSKDEAQLLHQALRFVPLFGGSLAATVSSVWLRMTLQREWRAWLSNHLYDNWLRDDHYIRLRFVPGDADSPEYRIAEDARIATDLPIDLVVGLLQSVLNIATFISVLWVVGDGLAVAVNGVAFTVPGYLVIAVIVYAALLAFGIVLTARHLTRVIEENKRTEAELRAIGTHVREIGEGKAVPDKKHDGRHVVGAALKGVIAIWRIFMWRLIGMTFVTYTSTLVTPVIGLLLCLPKYLADTMTLGEVVQASAAFVLVQSGFNWFTDNYAKLSEWAASANRVASLLLALDEIESSKPPAG